MATRREILGFLAVPLAAALSTPVAAADSSAKTFVTAISHYVGKDAIGMRSDRPATRRVFTPGLLKLIDTDEAESRRRNEPGRLDGDPFVDAQDWVIPSFTVTIQDVMPQRATARIAFSNQGKDVLISLDLVRLKGGWKIDEIVAPSGSLRALLTKK